MDVKRAAPDSGNAIKQDSDILNCFNAVVDAQSKYFAQRDGDFC